MLKKAALAVILCAGLPHIAHSEEAPKAEAAKPNPTWIVLLRLRYDLYARWKAEGKWPDDKAANAALEAHSQYWKQKQMEGSVILAGGMDGDYWDNSAQIIFRAPDKAAADAIVAADPAVKAYAFQAQIRPFTISILPSNSSSGN